MDRGGVLVARGREAPPRVLSLDRGIGSAAGIDPALKIRIALGPFQPLPPGGMGAVEKVWHELAGEFARRGHAVTLVGKASRGASMPGGVRLIALRGFLATGV